MPDEGMTEGMLDEGMTEGSLGAAGPGANAGELDGMPSPEGPASTRDPSVIPSAVSLLEASTTAFANDAFTSTGRIATPWRFASPAITAGE